MRVLGRASPLRASGAVSTPVALAVAPLASSFDSNFSGSRVDLQSTSLQFNLDCTHSYTPNTPFCEFRLQVPNANFYLFDLKRRISRFFISVLGMQKAVEWRKLPLSLTELCIDTTLRCGRMYLLQLHEFLLKLLYGDWRLQHLRPISYLSNIVKKYIANITSRILPVAEYQ